MPICKKCGKEFPNRVTIEEEIHVVCNRKFCLECSPFGKHNTKDITKPPPTPVYEKRCSRCKKIKSLDEFYKSSLKSHFNWCRKCNREHALNRQHKIKQLCVDYKGGCCQLCSYNKYIGALVFHHINPLEKDFAIARIHNNFNIKTISELDKCILLCANCHSEVHAGLIDISHLVVNKV